MYADRHIFNIITSRISLYLTCHVFISTIILLVKDKMCYMVNFNFCLPKGFLIKLLLANNNEKDEIVHTGLWYCCRVCMSICH